jgi:antitoxin component YwqK of YwqJK toxin-antitoxin module
MDSGVPPDDYTGWSKIVDRGQLVELVQWKNGEPDGPCMLWYENGKIWDMSLNREGKMVQRQTYYRTGEKQSSMSPADDGLQEMVAWHKNGKKAGSGIIKDGEPVMKFWDDKGQELDQEEGMKMMDQLLD